MNKEQLKEKHRSYLQELELMFFDEYSLNNIIRYYSLHFRLWALELMISWIKD